MLLPTTIKFLKDLKKNNNKDWFEKNRKVYETAKADYLNFVASVLKELQKNDATLEGLEPKQCVFRINRDVRFSKNKDPYKSNMGASFSKGGKKVQLAGYYFHCEPGQAFLGGGIWMPMAPELKKIRQEIDYNFDEFKTIITNKKLVAQFGQLEKTDALVRPPKGYEITNAAIEFLKLKSFIASCSYTDEDLTSKDLVKKITIACTTLKPFINFLNRA
ncbi:MAG: DUF2461 domain-containing protein, partial [Chitinophagaceae bacterium]|nr:DUF2461 domain-containing protein [Chitinophagaceae bacterium]